MSPVLQEVHQSTGAVAETVNEGGCSTTVTCLCACAHEVQVFHVGAPPGRCLKRVLATLTDLCGHQICCLS